MNDNLRDRIAAIIAAHEPVTDHDGADGECIECHLNPRWPDSETPTGPTTGWKLHAQHLTDAMIAELGLRQEWLTEESSRLGIVALTEPEHPIATRASSPWIAQHVTPRRLWDIFAEADTKSE